MVIFNNHIRERLAERGGTEEEVITTVEKGEQFPAKFNRTGFRSNFLYNAEWNGRHYMVKQMEVIAIPEGNDWAAVTVIIKYF